MRNSRVVRARARARTPPRLSNRPDSEGARTPAEERPGVVGAGSRSHSLRTSGAEDRLGADHPAGATRRGVPRPHQGEGKRARSRAREREFRRARGAGRC